MKHDTQDLTQGSIGSLLLWFTLPFLLSNLLQTLYGTMDTLTVGKFGSTAGLAAVSTGSQILGTVTFLAIGLSNGGMVLLGQCIGGRNHQKAAKVIGNVIISFTIISVMLMLITLLAYPAGLRLMNLPSEAMPEARNYMSICSLGIPLIIGYNIVCAVLRSMGDSKSPLLFVFVACLVNVAGDMLLTGILHMGAAGVAIATVSAQGVSFLYSLYFILRKGLPFPFTKSDIHYDKRTTRQIFRIGIPMALQSILINMSFMFITSIINAMGLSASAAMGIGDKITNFAFMPQSACAGSVAVIVAQNIGAKKPKRAFEAVRIAVLSCVAIELVFCLFCNIWPDLLPAYFSNDLEVIHMAGLYMRAYSIDAVLTAITFSLSGLLNGSGKTTFNMTQNLISTFLGRIPATWILSRLPGTNLFLIGCAAPASTLLSILMLSIYIGRGYWKKGLYNE